MHQHKEELVAYVHNAFLYLLLLLMHINHTGQNRNLTFLDNS